MEDIKIYKYAKSVGKRERWHVGAKFKVGGQTSEAYDLLFDTGADFTTLAIADFADELGINFEEEVNSKLEKAWNNGGNKNPMEFLRKTNWKNMENRAIPDEYGCACGEGDEGYLYPVEIVIGENEPFYIPVHFVKAKDIPPLLGRIGILDRASDIELDLLKGHGTIYSR